MKTRYKLAGFMHAIQTLKNIQSENNRRSMVTRDTEIEAMHKKERNASLQYAINMLEKEIDHYKEQLWQEWMMQ